MRRTRVLWLCCLFSIWFVSLSRADTIPDPDIQVNDPVCDSPTPCAPLVGGPTGTAPFFFNSNSTGGGSFSFEVDPSNTSGFFTLDIEALGAFNVTSCLSNKFTCSVSILNNSVTDMFFTETCGEGCSGGFPAGDVFTINLDNIGGTAGTGGWEINGVGGVLFRGEANLNTAPTTPLISAAEPSSLFLLCTGASALVVRRRMLKK